MPEEVNDMISTLEANDVETTETPEEEAQSTEEAAVSTESTQEEEPSTPAEAQEGSEVTIEQVEKRRLDSERNYQEANQARVRLEKEKAELEVLLQERASAVEDKELREKLEADPTATILDQFAQLRSENAALKTSQEAAVAQALADQKTRTIEDKLEEENGDYYDMVGSIVENLSNPADPLAVEFVEGGRTPEVAYKLAQREARVRELRNDPEAFEARLIEKLKEQLGAAAPEGEAKPATPTPLGRVPSIKPGKVEAPEGLSAYGRQGENVLPGFIS